MAKIIFGSNTFSSNSDFTVIGKDARGGIIFGGFGAPVSKPIVWIKVSGSKGLLNAEISDADGDLVLKIVDSKVILNKDNIYKVETIPDNQIPPDRIIVTNQYGETALDLSNKGDAIVFNADIYEGKDHIVATDQGTLINPTAPSV